VVEVEVRQHDVELAHPVEQAGVRDQPACARARVEEQGLGPVAHEHAGSFALARGSTAAAPKDRDTHQE
jgi:hypothetical protein